MGSRKKNRTFRSLTSRPITYPPNPAVIKVDTREGKIKLLEPDGSICNGRPVTRITFQLSKGSSLRLKQMVIDESYCLQKLIGTPTVNNRLVTVIIDGDKITGRRLGKHVLKSVMVNFLGVSDEILVTAQ